MAWKIEYLRSARKTLEKMDRHTRFKLHAYLEKKIAKLNNPRQTGSALKGSEFEGLWRYRMGDYRIICDIRDNELVILTVKIGHRKSIYED